MTIFIAYDLETHNTDRAGNYVICFYRLSKLAGRFNRDLNPYELEKCKKGTIVCDGDNCVTNALDFGLKLKRGETKGSKNETLEYNLQLHAHNGSGFDTWKVLKIFLVINTLLILSITLKVILN